MIIFVSQFLVSRKTKYELLGDFLLISYMLIVTLFSNDESCKTDSNTSNKIETRPIGNLLIATTCNNIQTKETKLHYLLHLINPALEFKHKINFALSMLNEIFPDKTIAYFTSNGNIAEFVCATRTNAASQVVNLTVYDDTIQEIYSRVNGLMATFNPTQQYIFSKPVNIKQTENLESGFFIPVHFYGKLEGILAMTGNANDDQEIEKIHLAESFSEGLAIVIQNDKLFNLPKKITNKDVRKEGAGFLLLNEMPNLSPEIIGWKTAQSIKRTNNYKGDFCDYIPMPNGDTMIIYGRCCAEGAVAAIFYLKLRAMIRCFASQQLSPAEMLNKLSFSLNFDSSCDTFATAAAISLSPNNREATISMAGAPIPIIIRTRSGFAETASVENNIPLGLFNQGTEPYKDTKFCLIPGDGLLLYTEGIMSYLNKKGEYMDTENLKLAFEQIPEQHPEIMLNIFDAQLKTNNSSKNADYDYLVILSKTE